MDKSNERIELKDCKYVDLKLRTRDPKIGLLTEFYCDQIETTTPKRTRKKTIDQAKRATRAIIADLFRARDAGNAVVAVSLCEGSYSSKRKSPVTYKSMRTAVDQLIRKQSFYGVDIDPLITQFKGFRSPSGYKDNTKLVLNEQVVSFWLDQLKWVDASNDNTPKQQTEHASKSSGELLLSEVSVYNDNHQYKEYINESKCYESDINQYIIEDRITPITSSLNFRYYTDEPRSVIALRDMDGISMQFELTPELAKMSRDVTQYNEYLSKHCVQLFVPDSEYDGLLSLTKVKLRERRCARDFSKTRSQVLGEEALSVYRVFNRGEFDCGGRHYGGYWQNLPGGYRPFITINGHSTIELDFKSMHPTMIYHQLNLPVEGDPYDLNGFPRGYRDTVKSAFMTLLNAKDVDCR